MGTMTRPGRLVRCGLTGTSLVAGLNTVENATIKVIDSSIELSDPDPAAFGGVLQLSTGGEGDEPGANGRIVIRDSMMTAGTIQVQTSFDWPGGTVVVRDSTLTTMVSNISPEASAVGGHGGHAGHGGGWNVPIESERTSDRLRVIERPVHSVR